MLYVISLAYFNNLSVSHVSVAPNLQVLNLGGKNNGKCKLCLEMNNFF